MKTPARKLKKSAVKNIVRFPSIKANAGKSILVESILESKYCLHLEFDSTVESYSSQPQTFTFAVDDEQRTYTPDFEVRYVTGKRQLVVKIRFNYPGQYSGQSLVVATLGFVMVVFVG